MAATTLDNSRREPASAARLIGAGSGIAAGLLAGLVPSLAGPGLLVLVPGDVSRYAVGIITLAIAGAALGPRLLAGSHRAALLLGWVWALTTFIAIVVAVSTAVVLAFIVENLLLPDVLRQLLLTFIALTYGVPIFSPGIVVGGLAWAFLARSLNRVLGPREPARPDRFRPQLSFARGAAFVLGSVVLAAGLVLAISGRPGSTRCLDVGGEVPRSGA